MAIKNGQSRETGNIGVHKTQDKDKQNKNTTQYLVDTTMCKETQIAEIRYKSS